jgi:DNA-binding cell septation regulator SpoVG
MIRTVDKAGSLLAFLDIETGSGLVIRDCRVMRSENGAYWIATPSVKQVDKEGNPVPDPKRPGKALHKKLVDFRDRAVRDKSTASVIAALRRQHPKLLGGEP